MEKNLKVWLDGEIRDYEDCKVPILTHSLQYGTGIFEGIRAYLSEDKGSYIFRLDDHVKRFLNSMMIYSIKQPYGAKELTEAIISTVRANNPSTDMYVRPFAFYNDDSIGISVKGKKVSVFVAAIPFGAYFKGVSEGIRCKVSSWERINSSILPVQAKASGNYINSTLASTEADSVGFDEAIMLSKGYVAEGPGENIFLVKGNRLITPAVSESILLGITRDSILHFAGDLGYEVEERRISREELYSADEIFFAGTAAEITPIVQVDSIKIGSGKVGDVTTSISKYYQDITRGRNKEYLKWLTKA